MLDSLDFLSASDVLDHIAPVGESPHPLPPQPLSTSEHKLSVWVRSAQIHIIYSSKTNRRQRKTYITFHRAQAPPLQQQRLTGGYKLKPSRNLQGATSHPSKRLKSGQRCSASFRKGPSEFTAAGTSQRCEARPSALHCTQIVFHTQQDLLYLLSNSTMNVDECMTGATAVGSNKGSLKRALFCSNNVSKHPRTSGTGILFYFPV